MIRVLIADDHPLFREALTQIVLDVDAAAQCSEAETVEQAVRCVVTEDGFDLVLLDLGLPGANGLSGVLCIRAEAPTTPVVIVSAMDEFEVVRKAMRLGVSGYLPKSSPRQVMRSALVTVLEGGTWFPVLGTQDGGHGKSLAARAAELPESLTPRQIAVLRLLGEGKSNKQIAYDLSISQETVKIHISAVLRKLGVSSRAQALLVAQRLGG